MRQVQPLVACFGTSIHSRETSAIREGTLRRSVYMNDVETSMWILMVEAGVAFFLLAFIVWWTMFAGRKDVDRNDDAHKDNDIEP